MRTISAEELESWLAAGRTLERDRRGPKVVALENGLFLKIFHTRRHPLLARLQPPATRFCRNAERLRKVGFIAPHLTELFWLNRQIGLSGCLYEPLAGESIEQLYRREPARAVELLPRLAGFIRRLHKQGIYFRSLHLGNILLLPEGDFGLIDILDLQFKRRALNGWLIKRNFLHMAHHLKRHQLEEFPLETLVQHYQQATGA